MALVIRESTLQKSERGGESRSKQYLKVEFRVFPLKQVVHRQIGNSVISMQMQALESGIKLFVCINIFLHNGSAFELECNRGR